MRRTAMLAAALAASFSRPTRRRLALVEAPFCDRLEGRRLFSTSIDANGWTQVTPAADTHVIYVSSSGGNDKNSGLSPGLAVASIARGESLLRNDSADWMLLKCGDTWETGLGNWRLSGRSPDEPMLVGSYGAGARPLLNTGSSDGLWAAAVSTTAVNNLDVIGLHFDASARDPDSPEYVNPDNSTGIQVLTPSDHLLIENCQIENYTVNINLQNFYGPITNASVRRNVIDDAYATAGHAQGMYAYGVDNLLVEGNTFDANGYNAKVSGAVATYYNHDCYISSNNTNVTVDDNIFARAAGYGLQMRPGGIVENNLFIDDPIGMSFGLVNGAHTTVGGVNGIVNGNVFVGGGKLDGSNFGQGIVLGNTKPGYPTLVSNNIFADGYTHAPAAITLTYGIGQLDPQNSVGLNDLTIEDNVIYNWYRGVYIDGGFQPGGTGLLALNDVTIANNSFEAVQGNVIQSQDAIDASQLHFKDNTYAANASQYLVAAKAETFGQWTAGSESTAGQASSDFVDDTRSLAKYDASLGGAGSDADFIAQARLQSAQTWNAAYSPAAVISYMQGGFTSASAPHDWTAPTPPVVTAVSFPTTVLAREATLAFTVTYTDNQAVNTATLGDGNLTVTAPGYSEAATFVSSSAAGAQVTATYTIPAPQGSFRTGAKYDFTVTLNGNQVTDNQGFAAQSGKTGSYPAHVLRRPLPPTVRQLRLVNHGQGLAVHFSEDVGASLAVSDLVLQSKDGQGVDPSLMTLTWNARTDTATWAFADEPLGVLPAGRWHARIAASTIFDPTGQPLDGNHNGVGGDDYVARQTLVSKEMVKASRRKPIA